uniref:Uncharacterized protein n=1 Tax=Rhizophora mucronata TaxID=61149 RepID=A0A2P2Q8Z2_RHIMU
MPNIQDWPISWQPRLYCWFMFHILSN